MTATVPASNGDGGPVVGLIAHMDTSPDAPGAGVEPIVHHDYDGGVIELPRGGHAARPRGNARAGREGVGHDIVTASGDTLLGADDKAGVAEIVTAVAHLAAQSGAAAADPACGFTPDEEIGEGASLFDIEALRRRLRLHAGRLGAGRDPGRDASPRSRSGSSPRGRRPSRPGRPGSWSTRCAWRAHSGRAPGRPPQPRDDPGREGFIHPTQLTGTPGDAELRAIVRDFDDDQAPRACRPARADHREAVAAEHPGPRPRSRFDPSTATCGPTSPRSPHVVGGGRGGDPGRGHRADPHRHPRRHRRLAAERDGAADAEPVHRRP